MDTYDKITASQLWRAAEQQLRKLNAEWDAEREAVMAATRKAAGVDRDMLGDLRRAVAGRWIPKINELDSFQTVLSRLAHDILATAPAGTTSEPHGEPPAPAAPAVTDEPGQGSGSEGMAAGRAGSTSCPQNTAG